MAPKFNAAHGAIGAWATAGKKCIDQGAEATKGVSAWFFSLAHHINLNGTQVGHRRSEFNIGEYFGQVGFKHAVKLSNTDTRQRQSPYAGDLNLAVAVYGEASAEVNTTPDLELNLVPYAQEVTGWGRNIGDGCVGVGR